MELEENKVQTYEWLKEVVRLKCRRLRGRFTRTALLKTVFVFILSTCRDME